MGDVLQEAGHKVSIINANDDPPMPDNYDAILIGGSVHIRKYQPAVAQYLIQHVGALNKMPGAFFSVCLAIVSDKEEERNEAHKITSDFLLQSGWKPLMTNQIAGAL